MPTLRNKRHEHFATLVANGVRNTEAAKRAGYNELRASVTGSELVRQSKIAARIEELRTRVTEQVVTSTGIDKAWVLEKLIANAEGALADTIEMQGSGKNRREVKIPPAPGHRNVANRAYELIGKELGMFVERVEHSGTVDLVERLQAARARVIDVTAAKQLEGGQ